MNTNLELYKVFYYVVKNGNITQAANELMVSQPAVSKSIKTLENDLNVILLNRSRNGISLTPEGEMIYDNIKKSIELIIAAENDLKNLNNMEFGNLNIGAGNTIIQKYLIKYIKEFHNKYPNINVKIHTLNTPKLLEMAQVGLIDIVFTHTPNKFPSNFKTVNIKELHDTFVVNSESKLLNKKIKIQDIKNLPLILLPLTASNRKSFDSFCINNNININPLMEVGNDIIIEELALSGLGVGLVTKEYVIDKINKKELFELNTEFKFEEKYLCYAINNDKKNNVIVKNFIKLLK